MLLLFELLEQLDRFLRGCAHWLILVDPAYVEDRQQLLDVAHDFVLEVRSDRIQRIDGDSLRLGILRFLDLLN